MGIIPSECRNTTVSAPFNYRKIVWGWPNLLVKRMADVNSKVLLFGRYERRSDKPGMNFIDIPLELAALPADYSGAIFVDRMDVDWPRGEGKRLVAIRQKLAGCRRTAFD